MLWLLTVVCFQFMGDYWLRHVRPDYTESFAVGVDAGVLSLVQRCVGADVGQWSAFARERMRLPIRFQGCGLREAADRRHGQYLGALVQSVPPLIDRTDIDGNVVEGRLHIPPVVDLLGEGSFSHPIESPWSHLLDSSDPTGNLATGLRAAWSHLSSSFQAVATTEQLSNGSLLINQDVTSAGFYADGTVPSSVTNALTVELERERSRDLGERITTTLPRTEYERWSWEGCTKMSSVFLHSPPDHFGHINNIDFQVIYATYLGQPCPLMAPVVGHFFGKDGVQLDRYGANLGSAILPGQGHRRTHNTLQSIVQSMMKLAGIASEKEALNFLLGKVGEPHISRYIDHVSSVPNSRKAPHAIVPDIHAFNWPTGSQRFNDSGVSSAAEAFFEVKTFSGCKSRYKHPNATINKPADRRAREVTREYPRKFKKLDELFAAEVVGDGTGDAVGPFEAAQGQFYRGQVIPLCAGWFGEVNKDFEKVLRLLARHAAAGDDGITISPLVNTDRKGGAYPIMLQQFRRAIGVAIVRGNAKLKLSRMHYVRETAREAAAVYEAHHSKNGRWRPGRNGSGSWFSSHIPEGYGAFEQFRNGYDFCMH